MADFAWEGYAGAGGQSITSRVLVAPFDSQPWLQVTALCGFEWPGSTGRGSSPFLHPLSQLLMITSIQCKAQPPGVGTPYIPKRL
jgi:hypothetical protein